MELTNSARRMVELFAEDADARADWNTRLETTFENFAREYENPCTYREFLTELVDMRVTREIPDSVESRSESIIVWPSIFD